MSVLLQAWPVIHPAIAAGAVAAGLIPVLIHLWHRRRFRRVPWAAMRFLLAANRRSARRLWIERLLLLLLRVAVITLFGLAVARPYLASSALTSLGQARVHRVVVLDNSLSMSAQVGDGRSRFDHAKESAMQLVHSFPEHDAVSVVTTAWPAGAPIDYAAFDRRFVRETLGRIEPSFRAGDMQGALGLARELVRSSEFPGANKAVYLISDFPRHEWVSEEGPSQTPVVQALWSLADHVGASADNLVVISVGHGRDLTNGRRTMASGRETGATVTGARKPNVAVTRLEARAPLIGVGLPVPLEIEVTNYGAEPLRDAVLGVLRDGAYIRREPLPRIEAGDRFTARVTTLLSNEGSHVIEARHSGVAVDVLAEDDARFLALEARRSTPVLLVDGRPGATRWQGEAGFLATALAPEQAFSDTRRGASPAASDVARISPLEPKVISEGEFPLEPLNEYAVVILCNVGRLTEEGWARLAQYVEGGGGLLVTLGDLVSAESYNRFGHADGEGILPVRLGREARGGAHGGASLGHATPLSAGGALQGDSLRSPGQGAPTSDEFVGFSSDGLTHPVVAPFGGHASSGLFLARVDRWMPMEVDPHRGETILRLTTGEPVLVAGTVAGDGKRGHVAVFGTSVNLSWTNLPAKGDFVSLMYNVVAYLAPRRGEARNLTVGATYEQTLSPLESSLPVSVIGPDGSPVEHSLMAEEEAFVLRVGPLERAGTYRLTVGAERRDLAVNVDPAESDLLSADEDDVKAAIDRPMRWIDDPQRVTELSAHGRAAEFAFPLFFCVAALLLIEVLAALWFGSPRGRGASRE